MIIQNLDYNFTSVTIKTVADMANTLQKQAKRISLILTLAAVLFTAVDNYLYLCHGIDIAPVTTPAIIVLAVSIVLCGVLQRYFYRLLTKYATAPSASRQEPEGSEAECTQAAIIGKTENPIAAVETRTVEEAPKVEPIGNLAAAETEAVEEAVQPAAKETAQPITSHVSETAEEDEAGITAGPHRDPYMKRYNQLQEELKQQRARRHAKLMDAIREYVTLVTAPFLSQKALDTLLTNIEQMACGRTDSCLPLHSNPDRPLRSPELRHLAWNIGERLGTSLEDRARFIKLSFPHELNNATVEYMQRNLRVAAPSHIPIDIPDEGDFRFHLELIGGQSGK